MLSTHNRGIWIIFFFQAEDGIRDLTVTGVQTCALPICGRELAVGGCQRATAGQGCGGQRGDPGRTESSSFHVFPPTEIGRASCRERVEISVVAVSLKKKKSIDICDIASIVFAKLLTIPH